MSFSATITQSIANLLTISNYPLVDFSFDHPSDPTHGDYATNVAMLLFPRIKNENLGTTLAVAHVGQGQSLPLQQFNSPRDLAEFLKAELTKDPQLNTIIDQISVAGPGFINFYLKTTELIKEIEQITTKGDQYGASVMGKGQTWLIEHSSPNPNKAMHLGHLRNNVTGMAIGNIAKFLGHKVIMDCIDNNRGIAIAKLMWGYLKFARIDKTINTDLSYWHNHPQEWLTPKEAERRPDRFLDELYVKASEDVKDPEVDSKVRQLVIDWENEDQLTWELWKLVLEFAYEGQRMTLDRLGSHWDHVWHEHEHYKSGKMFVEKGLAKGIFKIGDKGAIVTDLHAYKIPDTVVIKGDGTALYITQDLALTDLKFKTFHPDRAFWIIGPEQSMAMKQVFAVCEQLGIAKVESCTHLAYGYMSIKGKGKMSSRLGNVVYIDELIDLAKDGVKQIMANHGFADEDLDRISEAVALGAVKYSILKNGRLIDTSFDLETSISLSGNSGPYIQYTYARCKSVIEKGKEIEINNFKFQISNFKLNAEESALLRYLYRFPEVVQQAGTDFAPHLICTYLYELAQRFNTFYNQHSILGTPLRQGFAGQSRIKNDPTSQNASLGAGELRIKDGEQKENQGFVSNNETMKPSFALLSFGRARQSNNDVAFFRLSLTQATAQILENGLGLLGIKAPGRM